LVRLFGRAAGDRAVVSVQNPLVAGERSVPQPDIALLKPRSDSYTRSHPAIADVLLVVEVADTTLAFDIGTKVPLYARCGIPEVWVVDLNAKAVRVFRDPAADGHRTSLSLSGDQSAGATLLPDIAIRIAQLFPE
jgi:Uma2 family endonuclease